ncbi:MAG: DUF1761 domain-containing protein [bacterium]|nr:DUF1761 domain-containing protein [bacterium]
MGIGGIVLSVIAFMIIGSFWYSGAFLGKTWQKLVGLNFDHIDKEKMIRAFVGSAGAAFIMASILSYALVLLEVENITQAMLLGLVLWIGFMGPAIFINNLYQQKPLLLNVVDGGYQLVSIITMSAILYYFI